MKKSKMQFQNDRQVLLGYATVTTIHQTDFHTSHHMTCHL